MEQSRSFITPANRIANYKPYFFASLNQKINALKENGREIFRIDMGSPDLPPADFIIESLVRSAKEHGTHGYAPIGGTPEFKKAIVQYYKQRFDVDLNPGLETLALIGSKEGLFNLCQVLLNPGDVVLAPDPGYPVYKAGSEIAGATVYPMPLLEENDFLPDLAAIPAEIAAKAKLMWLNYPNNPTGAVATIEFFQQVVEFARQNEIVIAHDAPYVDICFDDYKAPSILSVPGSKDVCVEFNSLSKTYNMAGWRLGMAVGNRDVIRYLSTYKSQMDTSQFLPIYEAGITALTGDQSWTEERNDIYKHRRDIVVAGLKQAGFLVKTPPAAIYVWAHLPEGQADSIHYCEKLLEETGVSITPGVVYGQHGEGYIRISLGTATHRLKEAIQRLVEWTKRSE